MMDVVGSTASSGYETHRLSRWASLGTHYFKFSRGKITRLLRRSVSCHRKLIPNQHHRSTVTFHCQVSGQLTPFEHRLIRSHRCVIQLDYFDIVFVAIDFKPVTVDF